MSRVSMVDVASRLGISPQYLHRIVTKKTCDRERARQLAEHLGGALEDYLRDPHKRGRPSNRESYPFREFLRHADKLTDTQCESDTVAGFVKRLAYLYECYSGTRAATPYHVRDLAHLMKCLQAMKLKPEQRLLGPAVWEEYRVWQIQRECEDRIADVRLGFDAD